MTHRTKEFGSQVNYQKWRTHMGDTIRVLQVRQSARKFPPWGQTKNTATVDVLTVTYDTVEAIAPPSSM